jgi:hypothetical protein
MEPKMTDDKVPCNPFGDLNKIVPVLGDRTPAMIAVDQMFLDKAQKALAEAGVGALQFLEANLGVHRIELAKRLNRGVSAVGLIMAIYEEAQQKNCVRKIAKDLLIREIWHEYPDGWSNSDTVSASVRLGSWDYDISKYVPEKVVADYADRMIRHLTVEHPPPASWKPEQQSDPLIDALFDRYWPK